MAEIAFIEIFWRRNSPYGGYVANDTVSINYDTSTSSIVVRKNGGVITSGNAIPYYFRFTEDNFYYKTEKFFDPIVCESTDRIKLERNKSVFPYVSKVILSGSPSCAVTPVVCDLTFNSLPLVTKESSAGAADGSITVSAISSNSPIEYSLSDFLYGSGQSSGTFNNLASGTYRIFARDSANCSALITVIVARETSYSTLYTLEYDDRVGDTTKIEIQERDYSGASSDICGSGVPALIRTRAEGERDKFVTIIGTEIQIDLVSETNFKYLNLFTSDPNKYRVVYKKDFGSGFETLLTTKLLPNQYKENYTDPPYYVSFLGTDGLASLANIKFVDSSGSRFYGEYKAIKLLAYCLRNTGFDLGIRVAANIYATGMDTTAADDPLDQIYIDVDTYYIDETPSCLDVISFILRPFGAQLVQWNNYWNIVRVEEKVDSYDYRQYDYIGDYQSNSSYNPLLTSGNDATTALMWVKSPTLEMQNAYGTINLRYSLGLRNNLIVNGDFKLKSEYSVFLGDTTIVPDINGFQLVANGDDGVNLTYQIIDQNVVKPIADFTNVIADKNNIAIGIQDALGDAYIVSKTYNLIMGSNDQIRFSIKCGFPSFTNDPPYIKVRCVVTYGIYYLQGDGTWTTTANEIIFYAKEYGKFIEFSVTADRPADGASAGYDFNVKVYHAYAYKAEFTTVADQRAKTTTTLGTGHRTERYDSAGFDMFYYELENNTSAESVPDIVRPNDYNAVTNPFQWILKARRDTGVSIRDEFYIDKISVEYLFNGVPAPSVLDGDINGESNNPYVLEDNVFHGSLAETIQTVTQVTPVLPFLFNEFSETQYITSIIQNAEDIYTGYFRDSTGAGYTTWTRDYISETLELHEIHLRSLAAQYSSPWRILRGSLAGANYVTPISSIVESNDSNRIYYPISLEIDDLNRIFSGEYVELSDVVTSDEGDTAVGFTTGFTIGFDA